MSFSCPRGKWIKTPREWEHGNLSTLVLPQISGHTGRRLVQVIVGDLAKRHLTADRNDHSQADAAVTGNQGEKGCPTRWFEDLKMAEINLGDEGRKMGVRRVN